MIRRTIRALRRWLRGWFDRPRFRRVARVGALSELAAILPRDQVVLAGPEERPKWAAFMCPCDRGHQVTLSLQTSHTPHWQLRLERGGPTFYPSIDVPNAWRCHYWITRGRVHWAPSLPRS